LGTACDSLAYNEQLRILENDMNWRDRIVVDQDILLGKPSIKGSRISVELVLDRTADGWTIDDILAAYPSITREDVLAALSFAAELFREEIFMAASKVAA
jgi:uncharacterized protein (DUF433 family)